MSAPLVVYSTMRVLIVEDDAQVARLLRIVLERDGHHVVVAGDGAAGHRALTGPAVPDLLILDRMLPDMDGAELLAGLRLAAGTSRLPVLVISADRMAAETYDAAVTRVLAKPFGLTEFHGALSALLP
jgi:DNA-binding response OmpR family regulator